MDPVLHQDYLHASHPPQCLFLCLAEEEEEEEEEEEVVEETVASPQASDTDQDSIWEVKPDQTSPTGWRVVAAVRRGLQDAATGCI